MQKICYLKIACRNGIICLIFYRLRYINRENIAKCLENIQCFFNVPQTLTDILFGTHFICTSEVVTSPRSAAD